MVFLNTAARALSGKSFIDLAGLPASIWIRARAALPKGKSPLMLAGILGLAIFAPATAFAQNTVTAQMIVSLDIVDGCLVNGSQNPTTSMNFGTVQNAQAQTQAILAQTTLTIECNVSTTKGAILIGGGQNPSGGVRRMANAEVVGPVVPTIDYFLFADQARTDPYDIDLKNGDFTVTAGTPTEVKVYGLVPASAINNVPSGPYTDLLNVEVSF